MPILTPLLSILREWRLRDPGRLVVTNRDGNPLAESARVFQEVLHRVLDAAGFPKTERDGKVRRYIVFHSLRHTFAALCCPSRRGCTNTIAADRASLPRALPWRAALLSARA